MKVSLLMNILYLVLLEIILQQTQSRYRLTSACPNRVIRNQNINHCYEVTEQKLDWDTASATCMQQGGILATIETSAIRDEIQRITEVVNETEYYWIGLRRVGNSTQFAWTDGEYVISERWDSNNPVDGINCVGISEGRKWISLECNSSNYFVCDTYVCSNWTIRDGVCYKKFEETKNWTEAVSQCEQESAYLAEIPNIFINNIITSLIQGDKCWMGLLTNSSDYSWRVGNFPLADSSMYFPLNINDTNKCGAIGEGKEKTWGLEECSIKLNCAVCMIGYISNEERQTFCRSRTNRTIIHNGSCYRRNGRGVASLPIPIITCDSFDGSLYKFNEIELNIALFNVFNETKTSLEEFYLQDPAQYDSFPSQNGYLNLLTASSYINSEPRCKVLFNNGTLQDSVCETSINIYNYMCKSDYVPYENDLQYLLSGQWCYWSVAGNRDWTEEESRCEKKGGHLVEIFNENAQNNILSLISNEDEYFNEYYWIGIEYVNSSPQWRSGANITFSNFLSNSIQNITNTECVIIDKYGNWIVFNCNNTYSFICEKNVTGGDSSPCSPAGITDTSPTMSMSPTNSTTLSLTTTTNMITSIATTVTSSPTPPANHIINGTTNHTMQCSNLYEVLDDACTYFFQIIVPAENDITSGIELLMMREEKIHQLIRNVSAMFLTIPLQLIYSEELVLVITQVNSVNRTQISIGGNEISVGLDSFPANTTLAILVSSFTMDNLNYSIISDQITIVSTSYLNGELKISFQIQDTHYENYDAQTFQCVFLASDGNWSADGITTYIGCNKSVECTTNHLTTFAVLVSPYRIKDRDAHLELSLSITSYVLLSISLLFLLISLVVFIISGKLFFSVDVNILHFNYTLVLILALVCFIFGIELAKNVSWLCISIAFLLHFLWTNVFMSSLSIAIRVSYSIWVVGLKHRARNLSQYLIPISWCVSFVWAIIWLIYGLLLDGYIDSGIEDDNQCEINEMSNKSDCFIGAESDLIWTFLTPLFAILLINSTLLILSLYKIRLALKRQDESEGELKRLRKVARGGVSLVPALGLFFIFSLPLAFSELYKDVILLYTAFEFIFIIFVAPIGILHFIFITCQLQESKIAMLLSNKNSYQLNQSNNVIVSTLTHHSKERLTLNIARRNIEYDISLSSLVVPV